MKAVAEDLDAFRAAVGIGDVGGDGRKDLVVSVLQQPTSTEGPTVRAWVLRRSARSRKQPPGSAVRRRQSSTTGANLCAARNVGKSRLPDLFGLGL